MLTKGITLITAILLSGLSVGIGIVVRNADIPVVRNTGIAFGLDLPWGLEAVVAVILLIVLTGLLLFRSPLHLREAAGLALVLAGGLGNLVERLIFGHIVDYFRLALIPSFNIADLMIFIGALILIHRAIRDYGRS